MDWDVFGLESGRFGIYWDIGSDFGWIDDGVEGLMHKVVPNKLPPIG